MSHDHTEHDEHGGHGGHGEPGGHGGHDGGDDTLGVHGMALVGQETVYLSHLPMFMPPHDYQVILEVSFDEQAARRLRDSQQSAPATLHTVKPEEFPITELMEPGPGGARRHRQDAGLRAGLLQGDERRGCLRSGEKDQAGDEAARRHQRLVGRNTAGNQRGQSPELLYMV